ncbi:MAG: hypothetical protein H7A36_07060 [Chlamydiales bacterium]|nr:hypothetical protein [Chlamydiales bacterium]
MAIPLQYHLVTREYFLQKSLAQTRCYLVITVMAVVTTIFLSLAAYQILPRIPNPISRMRLGGRIMSVGIGALFTAGAIPLLIRRATHLRKQSMKFPEYFQKNNTRYDWYAAQGAEDEAQFRQMLLRCEDHQILLTCAQRAWEKGYFDTSIDLYNKKTQTSTTIAELVETKEHFTKIAVINNQKVLQLAAKKAHKKGYWAEAKALFLKLTAPQNQDKIRHAEALFHLGEDPRPFLRDITDCNTPVLHPYMLELEHERGNHQAIIQRCQRYTPTGPHEVLLANALWQTEKTTYPFCVEAPFEEVGKQLAAEIADHHWNKYKAHYSVSHWISANPGKSKDSFLSFLGKAPLTNVGELLKRKEHYITAARELPEVRTLFLRFGRQLKTTHPKAAVYYFFYALHTEISLFTENDSREAFLEFCALTSDELELIEGVIAERGEIDESIGWTTTTVVIGKHQFPIMKADGSLVYDVGARLHILRGDLLRKQKRSFRDTLDEYHKATCYAKGNLFGARAILMHDAQAESDKISLERLQIARDLAMSLL